MENIIHKINKHISLIFCFIILSSTYCATQNFSQNFKTLGITYTITDKGVLYSKSNGEWILLDSVDLNSFRTTDNYFTRMFAFDKYGILYCGERVSNDTIGFRSYETLENQYCLLWKTNKHVYWGGSKLENVDVATLEHLGYQYYKDKNGIYHAQSKLEDADPNSFLIVNDTYAIDSLHLYRQNQKVIVDDQNPKLINSSLYKTDKYVYWAGKYFTDAKDNPPIENLDTENLRQLADPIINRKKYTIKFCPYVINKDCIYYFKEPLDNQPKDINGLKIYRLADNFVLFIPPNNYYYERYTLLEDPLVSGDSIVGFSFSFPLLNKGLYMAGRMKIIPFNYDFPIKKEDFKSGNGYFIYKNQFYDTRSDIVIYDLDDRILKLLSKGQTLRVINNRIAKSIGKGYFKDNNSVYYGLTKLDGISSKKIEIITSDIFKNSKGVFLYKENAKYNKDTHKSESILRKIKDADKKSFCKLEVMGDIRYTFSVDKHNLYSEDEIVPSIKSKNIRLLARIFGVLDSKEYLLISNIDGYWLVSPKQIESDIPSKSQYLGKEFPYQRLNLDTNEKEPL